MSTTSSPAAALLEPHFTLAQVAEAWGVSTDTVRRMFEGEPGGPGDRARPRTLQPP